jgi:hypothetical protein
MGKRRSETIRVAMPQRLSVIYASTKSWSIRCSALA